MLKLIIRELGYRLASKKMNTGDSVAGHGPTIDMWSTGDGIIGKKQIVVSGWNVNGYRSIAKKGGLDCFLQKVKPDWLCLNQTKIDLQRYRSQVQSLKIPGYNQYWNFCKISSGYSGVMILTPFKPIRIVEDIPEHQTHSLQGRMLTLQYETFYLVNVYKPNVGTKLQRLDYRTKQYDLVFNYYIKELMLQKNVIIFGDMNVAHQPIDLANPRSNNGKAGYTMMERSNFTNLLNLNLNDTFRLLHPKEQQYTYWSHRHNSRERNIGWRIDYILTSKTLKVDSASIHSQIQGSDHCPISAKIIL